MAWTSGDFEGRLTARAVVAFVFGKNLARQQLVDVVKVEDVVYAAVRCKGTQRVWGIVFVVNREGKRLHVKPISENLGHSTTAAHQESSTFSASLAPRRRATGALAVGPDAVGTTGQRSVDMSRQTPGRRGPAHRPPTDPHLDRAWQIVAIKLQLPLAPYFTAIRDAQEGRLKGPKLIGIVEVTKRSDGTRIRWAPHRDSGLTRTDSSRRTYPSPVAMPTPVPGKGAGRQDRARGVRVCRRRPTLLEHARRWQRQSHRRG